MADFEALPIGTVAAMRIAAARLRIEERAHRAVAAAMQRVAGQTSCVRLEAADACDAAAARLEALLAGRDGAKPETPPHGSESR